MLTIKGKYNTATVYTDILTDSTANHDSMQSKIRTRCQNSNHARYSQRLKQRYRDDDDNKGSGRSQPCRRRHRLRTKCN